MELDAYQDSAMKTAGDFGETTERLLYSALAVAGEAGEFADLIKKNVFHKKEVAPEVAAAELGDVLWGVAYAAQALGYTLESIARINLDKLSRRYGTGFTYGGGVR